LDVNCDRREKQKKDPPASGRWGRECFLTGSLIGRDHQHSEFFYVFRSNIAVAGFNSDQGRDASSGDQTNVFPVSIRGARIPRFGRDNWVGRWRATATAGAFGGGFPAWGTCFAGPSLHFAGFHRLAANWGVVARGPSGGGGGWARRQAFWAGKPFRDWAFFQTLCWAAWAR